MFEKLVLDLLVHLQQIYSSLDNFLHFCFLIFPIVIDCPLHSE